MAGRRYRWQTLRMVTVRIGPARLKMSSMVRILAAPTWFADLCSGADQNTSSAGRDRVGRGAQGTDKGAHGTRKGSWHPRGDSWHRQGVPLLYSSHYPKVDEGR